MKKVIMLAAFVAALASCQSKADKNAKSEKDIPLTVPIQTEEVYQGLLPAADGPGIRYVLTLNTDTTYRLDMTYLAKGSGKDQTFSTQGKKDIVATKNAGAIVELTPDNGESPTFFRIVNDTTLRLVNDKFEEADSKLNYDITKVKK